MAQYQDKWGSETSPSVNRVNILKHDCNPVGPPAEASSRVTTEYTRVLNSFAQLGDNLSRLELILGDALVPLPKSIGVCQAKEDCRSAGSKLVENLLDISRKANDLNFRVNEIIDRIEL